jgi:hypothetical protein
VNPFSIETTMKIFFEWSRARGYFKESPTAHWKKRGSKGRNKDYYSVETFARMLRIAVGLEAPNKGQEPTREFIDLLPRFVVSGFLGLRSCEAFRSAGRRNGGDSLRWDDIREDNVEVRHAIAKHTRRKDGNCRRIVETSTFIEAAKAWLQFVPRTSPFVVSLSDRTVYKLQKKFQEVTGINFHKNGLRNSFSSYALNLTKSAGRVSLEAGNSEAILKANYATIEEPGQGACWFGLRPFEVVPQLEEKRESRAVS